MEPYVILQELIVEWPHGLLANQRSLLLSHSGLCKDGQDQDSARAIKEEEDPFHRDVSLPEC